MASNSGGSTEKNSDIATELAELKAEVRRLREEGAAERARFNEEIARLRQEKGSNISSSATDEKDESEPIVDVAVSFVRSIADAQIEFIDRLGGVVSRASKRARDEMRVRDDEDDDRKAAARIPGAFITAVSDTFSDQGDALDQALERFSESFKENRSVRRRRRGA